MRRHGVMVLAMTVILVLSASIGVAQTESNESDEGNLVINVVLPIALAYIMFSLGIGLKVSDFSSILDNPKAFAVGLTNQMVLLPIVAFTISHGLELTGEMAVGLMILACCPGGVTSNIISRISGGDTALSISYTAVVSLVSVLTLPIIVGMSMSHFMGSDAPNIGILSLGLTMFLLTTVPVVSGMFVRHFLKNSADKMEKIGNNIASLLFVVIVFAAIASEFDTLVDNMSSLGPAVFILNVMMLAIGLGSSNYFDLNEEQSLTVSIESGIQNATVGITIGGLIMAPEAGASLSLLSLPSGVYGVVMYLVIIPFLFWRSNRSTS